MRRWNISSWRVWLFRSLVAVAAGLMLVSFIMPWWTANLDVMAEIKDPIRIYGHGLQHNLVELRQYIETDETPFYQTVLAWVFIAASVGLILFSIWLKGKKGRWLMGGIGLIYIAYVAIAVFVVISGRLGELGIQLQGPTFVPGYLHPEAMTGGVPYGANMHTTLRFGYYLAYIAGGMCIVLALLRNIITGRPKLGT